MNQLRDFKKNHDPYYDLYLKNIESEDDIFNRLSYNQKLIYDFFSRIEESKYDYAYAKKKWTISQIFQHIIDTERIFCYRALKIVREENPIIKSYDHESYALNANFKSKAILLEDYKHNRMASVSLFKTFINEDFNQSAEFSDYNFCVGLIPFIICGHELHHLKVIESKYL